jgi:sec-independent protein translocase protein TatC
MPPLKGLRPIGHEERLSVVDHLDELRNRLFVCAGVLIAVFCICFAFNHPLINILNRALPQQPSTGLGSQPRQNANQHDAFREIEHAAALLQQGLAASHGVSPTAVQAAGELEAGARAAVTATPKPKSYRVKPITIGVGESFTTTLIVAGYFALLISLPVILYELYAFVIPAFSDQERRIAIPSMIAAPVLFAIGAVFTYFEVLPPAVHFLQGYNSGEFQILIGAGTYYKFEILMMLGIGLAFQVPLLLLALQKAEIITAQTLTLNWRYCVVIIAVIAAALPGVDPVTMFFETLPLVLLYLVSIVMLQIVERRKRKRLAAEAARAVATAGEGPTT